MMNPVVATWQKSTFCNGASSCVEVSTLPDGRVAVRDGKDPDGPVLHCAVGSWWSFIAAVKTGQVLTYAGILWVADVDAGWLMWLRDEPDVTLWFDRAEVAAFVAGVEAREFDPDRLVQSAAHGSDVNPAARVSAAPLAPEGASRVAR